eukprot:TRINITY_DN2191_c0_g1_i1.p1 TRINITY_DN2191_c0_g1~~TRINITY_DN2191_c0_g1_i1.p1  ORF type:complete len:343 (-),score=79.69 TRINITY_DN2191_c0_g1_i1:70-1065(-)
MSSSEEDDGAWVPYSERSEWKDIEPIHQSDDDNVVRINYTDKFRDVYSYFWAILSKKEVSQRALDLTKDAAELNPSNYTVWHYRRIILEELGVNLVAERIFCREIMEDHPKCYQVWEHRKKIVEKTKDPSKELRLTEIILSKDAKNYHAWQHRLWVVCTYKLFEDEVNYTERLLKEDVFNNSAWNHRLAVLDIQENGVFSSETLETELQFTLSSIEYAMDNESSWSYLTTLLEKSSVTNDYAKTHERIRSFIEGMFKESLVNIFMLGAWIDLLELAIKKGDTSNREDHLKKMLEIIDLLTQRFDTRRAKYWTYLGKRLSKDYGGHVINAQA